MNELGTVPGHNDVINVLGLLRKYPFGGTRYSCVDIDWFICEIIEIIYL